MMTRRATLTFTALWLSLASLALWPRLWSHMGLWCGWLGALSLPLVVLTVTLWRARRDSASEQRHQFEITSGLTLRQPLQSVAQVMIYVGLSLHWPRMSEQLPLTLAQVAFAYLIDILWVWIRGHRRYRISVSPTPIVLSVNLFLWFKDEVFYWQWVLIFIAVLSRALITWERPTTLDAQPRRANIFNPSALVISLAGCALIVSQSTDLTWGEEIAVQHGADANAYWVIFAAGLLAQCFAPIGWVTLGGVIGYLTLDTLYFSAFGSYRFIDTAIPPAVFLGLNLLITDPRTIPRARSGQLIYGLSYALLSFACFSVLKEMSYPATATKPAFNPTFLDKALAIPLLNLCVRGLDQLFKPPAEPIGALLSKRALWIAMWAFTFTALVAPRLERHPGAKLTFWETSCASLLEGLRPEEPPEVCRVRDRLFSLGCQRGQAGLCDLLAQSPLTAQEDVPRLARRACKLGSLTTCVGLGAQRYDQALALRAQSSAQEIDLLSLITEAESLWQIACPLALPKEPTLDALGGLRARGEACFHLANLYATPWRSAPDMPRAVSYLRLACEAHIPEACQALTRMGLRAPPLR